MVTNFAASIIDKLKNVAKENNKAFNAISILYYQERFLKRLSMSNYQENFILKGGLYLYSVTKFKSRPTKDMDFSGQRLSNDSVTLVKIITDICKVQPNDVENDGIVFHTEQIQHLIIKEDAEYEGVRITIPCSLGNMKERLQLDIGFGDVIIPNPQTIDYPVLLPHMSTPELFVYTNESVIAEKFEAMVSLSVVNSRMKDFYDIFTLARTSSFKGFQLCQAVSETFKRRATITDKDHIIFSKEFYNDKRRLTMWSNFIDNLKPDHSPTFQEVMEFIHTFLKPIYNHVLDERDFLSEWNHHKAIWED
ncbi:nucleotidyl transferase AbiEii/AbiGii toxin family protein [Paenibacillus wenxiniae]|uniref:Nucleotidyl transferase AbiEii/AbiGii toxin family protein n=1 Tax=Paenibacillus wenxiniae TaxID=1636843 RepID=A0ABW4RFL6_9BACL